MGTDKYGVFVSHAQIGRGFPPRISPFPPSLFTGRHKKPPSGLPGGGELRIALPKNGQKVLMTVLPVAGEM